MTFSKTLAVAALCVATISTGADAWWCTGHMITAEIARQNLETGVEAKVNAYFTDLQKWGPFPQSSDMIGGSCWADDLKAKKLYAMASWHFIDQPVIKAGFVPAKYATDIPLDNVASELTQLSKTAESRAPTTGEFGWGKKANNWEVAFAIANLVHFYGDIHQPLHAAELFSSEFPSGDLGGNLFTVQYQGKTWKLHAVWDSVCNKYPDVPSRPLNGTSAAFITNAATTIAAANPSTPAMKSVYNSTIMAQESKADAIKYAYANLISGQELPADYMSNCAAAAELRLALGGYRLASQLNYIFAAYAKDETRAKKIYEHIREGKRNMMKKH